MSLSFQKVYEQLLLKPPEKIGSKISSAFWNGFSQQRKPAYIPYKTAAYAAWKAGKEYKRRKENENS